MFLENTIRKHTSKPVFTADADVPSSWLPAQSPLKPNLIAWPQFKTMLFKIYDHRLEHAEEIDGSVNTSYMSFDEHLLVVMLEWNQTRTKSEAALVDFLSSLKFYCDSWQRAKVYA